MSTWQQYMGDIWVPSAPSGDAGIKLKDDLQTLRDYAPKSSFSETTNPGPTNDDSEGMAYQTTDPAGTITQQVFDRAGRRVALIENVQGTTGDDKNRTTVWSYTPDGQIETLTALNSTTGDQTTRYTFGVTTTGSTLCSNDLLHIETYPDGGVVTHEYNRQAERIKTTDQNGTVHEFDRDKLGRQTDDRVTNVGGGIDDAVLRIGIAYEVRGMVETITSYDAATNGDVVNQVKNLYNTFSQLASQAQEHDGAVSGTTPKVLYAYANGSANTVRPTSVTYPNGRVLNYDYTAPFASELSRIGRLIFDGDNLVDYEYLGLGSFVQVNYIEPSVRYDLATGSGANFYAGLDRFGRAIDLLWRKYSTTAADLEHLQYGYDRASNRTWRKNLVSAGLSTPVYMDELYTYDGLYQLQDMKRGQLTGTPPSGITALKFEQQWVLDPTGNWKNFREDATGGGSWTLNQTRSANEVNEITAIGTTTGANWTDATYDAAGNTIGFPQPATPTTAYTAVYDAWNRLVKLMDGATIVAQYAYDAHTWRTTSGSGSGARHYYCSDSWQLLEERLGASPSSASPDRQLVWGLRYIDDIILRDRSTTGTLNERLYSMHDANWNVGSICDTSAEVQERYAYSGYGTPLFLSGSYTVQVGTPTVSVLFASYLRDPSCLWYVRFRQLHSLLGRFLSGDPRSDNQNVHRYAYVDSAPIISTDPLGLYGIFMDGAGQPLSANTSIRALYNMYKGAATRFTVDMAIVGSDFSTQVKAAHAAACVYVCDSIKCCKSPRIPCLETVEPADLFGWSRGAVGMIALANSLLLFGCDCKATVKTCYYPGFNIKPVPVRFLGLIDPVATGVSHRRDIPLSFGANVRYAAVARSTEHDALGSLVFLSDPVLKASKESKLNYGFFQVKHQLIGWPSAGGDAVAWLLSHARAVGVPI